MDGDIQTRVIALIAETQHVPADTIKIDKTFEELNIDSLDAINIVFAVEEEFAVRISDDQLMSLRSIRDVVEGLEKLLNAKAAS